MESQSVPVRIHLPPRDRRRPGESRNAKEAPYRAVCLSGSQGQPLVVSFYPAGPSSRAADERARRAAMTAIAWIQQLALRVRDWCHR